MKFSIQVVFILFAFRTYAANEKIDWKPCDREVKEFCTTVNDDHEKHECLEEAPKAKISKTCATYNSSLEEQFKEKHKH